jgi:hypothetical protein
MPMLRLQAPDCQQNEFSRPAQRAATRTAAPTPRRLKGWLLDDHPRLLVVNLVLIVQGH